MSKEELWSFVWLISRSEHQLGEIFGCLLCNYIGHASASSTQTPQGWVKGTCAMIKYGSFRGFWKRYIHLCLWILYQGVNRSRLRWKTLHSSRTIDVRVQRVQQLLSDFSNCFMHHLKCKTVYHFRFVLHVSPNRRTISKPSRQPESFKSLMWGDSRLSRWWIFITYTFNKSSRERRPRSRFFYVTIS